MSMSRIKKAGGPQDSVLSPTLFNIYINDPPPKTISVHLALFAGSTCLYATERKGGLCPKKTSACAQFNGGVVQSLEH
jgi:hypothetical protein